MHNDGPVTIKGLLREIAVSWPAPSSWVQETSGADVGGSLRRRQRHQEGRRHSRAGSTRRDPGGSWSRMSARTDVKPPGSRAAVPFLLLTLRKRRSRNQKAVLAICPATPIVSPSRTAVPAAGCRKRRRRSFMACLPWRHQSQPDSHTSSNSSRDGGSWSRPQDVQSLGSRV
jgi:hypothetical protein